MAEVTTITNQFKYDFEFSNASESTATRSFTIDTKNFEAGLSYAKALQDFFAGTGSLSVASIVPKEFIQPTGWRDNNPNEPPWTTQKVYLTGITKYETSYDPAGGGESPSGRNLVITGASDEQDSEVHFTYDGADSSTVNKPRVEVFYNGVWNEPNITFDGNGYYFEKTAVMKDATGTISIPSKGTLPADFGEFTIAY